MKSEPKKKKKKEWSDPFLPHVVGNGEEIKQGWGGRQVVVKAEQINRRWRRFSSLGNFPLSLSSFDKNQMVWLCVTFKFVCFDGIEGKKLAEEVVREKWERNKENKKRKRALWNVLEFGGSGREKRGKKKKKKRVRVRVWRRKKEGKKEEGKKKEIWMKKTKK